MPASTSDVSVIVCHHTGDLIHDFLASFEKYNTVSAQVYVMTSDPDLKSERNCHIIYTSKLATAMPAEKRNIAASICHSKYLAFFDDDMEFKSDILLEFIEAFRSLKDCGMVYGKLHKGDDSGRLDEAGGFMTWNGFIWSRAEQNVKDVGQFDMNQCILAGKSASCMIERELFNTIGGFDENFGILGEETDLSWRVWLQGKRVYFVPSAQGIHYFNTPRKPFKKFYSAERVYFNGCRNYITMLIKNVDSNRIPMVALHALIWWFVGIAQILTFHFRAGFNIWRGIGYVIENRQRILQERAKIQSRRRVGNGELDSFIYARVRPSYYIQRFFRYILGGLHG